MRPFEAVVVTVFAGVAGAALPFLYAAIWGAPGTVLVYSLCAVVGAVAGFWATAWFFEGD